MFQTFKHPIPNIKWNFTSAKEIEKIIKSLKSKNTWIWWDFGENLKLSIICNKSLSGIFPTCLKFSEIKSLFKKDSTTNIYQRYQRVLIETSHSNNSISSDWVNVKNWVPQNSILGPLFFLFHINILPGIITNISYLNQSYLLMILVYLSQNLVI